MIEFVIYYAGRVACRLLRRHNVSCRGRRECMPPRRLRPARTVREATGEADRG